MSIWEALLVLVAGLGAGTINTIVGSGTLITFPTLLFLGVPPLSANVSNNLGLVAGGLSGTWGYRSHLAGQSDTLRRLIPVSLAGAVVGAMLLLVLPPAAFRSIVSVLIVLAIVLVLVGPRLQRTLRSRQVPGREPAWRTPVMAAGIFFAGVYGGYFGAAQGVLVMGLLSALSSEHIQRLNAYKQVQVTLVNIVAAVAFLAFAREHIQWGIAALIAVGAFAGGVIGSRVAQRLSPNLLRAIIVVVGTAAVVRLVGFS